MNMKREQAIQEKEAQLRKQTFFDPTLDAVFKKIFSKKSTLIHFLNAILRLRGNREIKSITNLRPTIHLRTLKKGKKIVRFDIHAHTADGRFIDIEMQRANHEDFLDRIELYSSLLAINAKITMDNETSKEQLEDHPYLMPSIYSIWICDFDVKFCKTYHEEFGLFRLSDLGKSSPLPIYNKKRYIIIDLTKYVPQKSNSVENKWIELFRSMPEAKSVPKGIDDVLKDVYERALVRKSSKKFITEVAKSMETKEEISTRMGTARREGIAIGKRKGRAEGRALERKRQLAIARGLYKKGVALSVLASSFNYTEKQIAG